MWKFIGVVVIVVVIGIVAYVVRSGNARITALDSEQSATSTPESTSKTSLSKKEVQVSDFEERYAKQLRSAKEDVAFSGGEFKAGDNAKAPGTLTEVIDGGFVVRTPDVSEDEIRAAAVIERLEYTLGNLEPLVLDAMMAEYLGSPEVMLSDMGLVKRCVSGLCGYQVQDGPFLQAVALVGVQQSDTILTINNVSIGDISDYASFKTVVFSNADVIQMTVDRAGDVMTVDVPVK